MRKPASIAPLPQDYAALRKSWNHQFFEDEEHPVVQQIGDICWDHMVFRIFWLAINRLKYRKTPSVLRNQLVADQLGPYALQRHVLAIRRVTDSRATQEKYQVISLRRLIDELGAPRTSITREAYVTYGGVPYDPAPAKALFLEKQYQHWQQAGHAVALPSPIEPVLDFTASQRRHTSFDLLACVAEDGRARNDTVRSEVVNVLQQTLESAVSNVRKVADKRLAHAADGFSRSAAGPLPDGIPFKELEAAHRAILAVADFFSAHVLDKRMGNPMPHAAHDVMLYAETSGLSASEVARLARIPDAMHRRFTALLRDGVAEVSKAIAKTAT